LRLYTHRVSCLSGLQYDMVQMVCSSLEVLEVTWGGLNAAWPLYQGLPTTSVRKASPCANEACGRMTYPKKIRPEGSRRTPRGLFNPFDSLGEYLCSSCNQYRLSHEETLPDAAWCAKWDANWEKYWTPERVAYLRAARKTFAELRAEGEPLECADCLWKESLDLTAGICRLFEEFSENLVP
jgi:hypothetical protein